jgi:hypothetical protein
MTTSFNFGLNARQNVSNGQNRIAKAWKNSHIARLSGEGSISMANHRIFKANVKTADSRHQEIFANQQTKADLEAYKNLTGLSTIGQG